jgi:hypothetical protein
MGVGTAREGARSGGWAVWSVAAAAGFLASLGLIGADALWLVPLGREVAHGHLPGSIPWATAPTSGWHDVPALGQLAFWAAHRALGGDRGLVVAQTVAAVTGFWALARGLSREAASGAVLAVSGVVLVGSLAAVFVVGVSLFSLALFPLLLLLLESESRSPGRKIWLAVPIIALWGNLHGGVLAGIGLLACYLLLDRARREPWASVGVLAAAIVALCLNPALWNTPSYYRGVLGNEAARMRVGLWTPLRLGGVDLFLIAAAIVLAGLVVASRRRVRLWEAAAMAGLVIATIDVARTGTWLLFVAAYPAARALRLGAVSVRLVRVAALVLAGSALVLLARGPRDPGSRPIALVAARTGQPVLAAAILGQQVALAGGRVWVNNPIDAFRRADQRLYLKWVDGRPGGAPALAHARYVLVTPASAAGRLAARDTSLALVAGDGRAALYRVRAGRRAGR